MIRFLIKLYIIVLIADAILSYFPKLRRHPAALMIKRMADFTLRPVRKILPSDLPIDVSPLIVIILLQIFIAVW